MFRFLRETIIWLVLVVWACAALWPAEYWMEPGKLIIEDYQQGTNFRVESTSYIRNSFTGSYNVVIRDLSGQVIQEDPSGVFPYQKGVKRPDPIFIDWWAPRLKSLSQGSYVMKTCWTIHQPFLGLVPNKAVCVESNIFRVL